MFLLRQILEMTLLNERNVVAVLSCLNYCQVCNAINYIKYKICLFGRNVIHL